MDVHRFDTLQTPVGDRTVSLSVMDTLVLIPPKHPIDDPGANLMKKFKSGVAEIQAFIMFYASPVTL